ncbi:MAG: hypothetical protein KJ729_05635 [Euryarchaeota archaeon]|nr:hypothetical protein [Euryarchaeota archaeon]
MEKVSIVKCENYEHDNVKNAIKKSLDLVGGLSKFVKPGNTVLVNYSGLKPRSVPLHRLSIESP